MPIVNVKLDVTPEEAKRIAEGTSQLMGLIKNSASKQIERHVPTVIEKATKEATKQSSKFSSKGILIGIGVFAVVAVGATITYAAVKHNEKKKEESQRMLLTEGYNTAISNYVSEAYSGKLSFNSLKRFTDYMDSVLKNSDIGNIELDLSSEEVEVLYGVIKRFTEKICKANQAKLPTALQIENQDVKQLTDKQKLEKVRDLLYVQQEVFVKVK